MFGFSFGAAKVGLPVKSQGTCMQESSSGPFALKFRVAGAECNDKCFRIGLEAELEQPDYSREAEMAPFAIGRRPSTAPLLHGGGVVHCTCTWPENDAGSVTVVCRAHIEFVGFLASGGAKPLQLSSERLQSSAL